MTSTINASTSSGIVSSADTSGVLALQSNGTTALTVGPGYAISTTNTINTPGVSLGFKNRIINGAMLINQRGGGTNLSNTYGLDRWAGWRGGYAANLDMSQQAGFSGFQYCMRAQRTSGTSSTADMDIAQVIETLNCYDLAGKSVTISGNIRTGSNYSGGAVSVILQATATANATVSNLSSGSVFNSAVSTTVSVSTTASTFTLTGTVPAGTQTVAIQFTWYPTGTAGANDYIELTGVQLEVGTAATSFEFRDYGRELIMCQRYYQAISSANGGELGLFTLWGASDARIVIQTLTPMRTAPSVSSSNNANDFVYYSGGVVRYSPSVAIDTASTPYTVELTSSSMVGSLTAGYSGMVRTGGTTAYVGLSAEL